MRRYSQLFWYKSRRNGMENSSGKWILVETFFQNEGDLVEIFKGWILVDIFHEFSWTFFVHENSPKQRNFRGHFVHENSPKKFPREFTKTNVH